MRASVWTSFSLFASISMWTRATPLCRLTAVINPTVTPATATVWPWPGVTAWALLKSAWMS